MMIMTGRRYGSEGIQRDPTTLADEVMYTIINEEITKRQRSHRRQKSL